MKNSLQLFVTGILCSFLMASCSQSQDLVSEDRGPQYRYNKVYEGNKILYRGLSNNVDERENLALHNLMEIQEASEKAETMPIRSTNEASPKPKKASAKTFKNETSIFRDIGDVFVNNINEIRSGVQQGDLLGESTRKIKDNFAPKAADSPDDTMAGASEIFAILGFIFGLASFINSYWFVGAILGVVFSVLGWNSEWHIFALLGLIFSVAGAVLGIIL